MIEFSCHTWAFNDLTLPEALGTIARMGFRYVDIGSGQNLNAAKAALNPRPTAEEIGADLELFHLSAADLYLMLPRIASDEDERREKEVELFKALMPFAAALGVPGVTVSPGIAQTGDDALLRATAALREMMAAAKSEGLRLSIEPHLDSVASTPDAALKLTRDVPGLEITLDWAHMVCQGLGTTEIEPLLPHTRHIQVRQAARKKLQTPYEQGQVNPASVLELLVQHDYDGVVCVEYMNTPGWHGMISVDSIRDSVRLRDALRDARDRLPGKAGAK